MPGCRGKGEVDGIILATFQGLAEIGERKIGLAIGKIGREGLTESKTRGALNPVVSHPRNPVLPLRVQTPTHCSRRFRL